MKIRKNNKNSIQVEREKLNEMTDEALRKETPLSKMGKITDQCEKVNQLIIDQKTEQ